MRPCAAAALRAVGGDGRALQVAGVRDGDRHLLVDDQVFELDFGGLIHDLGAALVAELLFDLFQFLDDHPAQLLLRSENGFVLGDALANFLQLVDHFVDGKARQAVQLQLEDGVGLAGVEALLGLVAADRHTRLAAVDVDLDRASAEVRDQVFARLHAIAAAANDGNNVVEPVHGGDVAFQDVLTVLGLAQQVGGAAAHHVDAVINKMIDRRNQPHLLRLAIDHRQEDHAEALLHLGVLVELVEHDLWLGAALQFDHDAHALAIAFVADVADVVNRLVVHQVGDALHQPRLVHLVGNLGNDDRLPLLGQVFDRRHGPHDKTPAAGLVGLGNAGPPVNEGAGGEIRAFDDLQNLRQLRAGLVHQHDAGIHDLGQVVRWDIGRHADGDAVRAVHQQVGNGGRQNHRFNRGVVEVGDPIHGFLVDVGEHLLADGGHAAFGVPIGRRRIAIHRAEVALSIHQRIAHGEGLRHAHQSVVQRGVAVRVILAQTFAHHLGALHVLAVGEQAHVVHGIKNAAMHRLQAVADVGQRAPDDHRHRIVEIRPPHLLFNVDGLHVGRARALAIAAAGWKGKLGILFVCHLIQLSAVSFESSALRPALMHARPCAPRNRAGHLQLTSGFTRSYTQERPLRIITET